MAEPEPRPWSWQDEKDLLFEIREDRCLRRLGIDSEADPLSIYLELAKRKATLDVEHAKRQRVKG